MNVYQSTEWVERKEETLLPAEIKPEISNLGTWIKILVTMVKNFINNQMPSGAKFH